MSGSTVLTLYRAILWVVVMGLVQLSRPMKASRHYRTYSILFRTTSHRVVSSNFRHLVWIDWALAPIRLCTDWTYFFVWIYWDLLWWLGSFYSYYLWRIPLGVQILWRVGWWTLQESQRFFTREDLAVNSYGWCWLLNLNGSWIQ